MSESKTLVIVGDLIGHISKDGDYEKRTWLWRKKMKRERKS